MSDGRRTASLGDLIAAGAIEVSDGYRTRHDQLGTAGLPILRVADVLDGVLAPSYKDHVRLEYRAAMGTKTSRTGDVLITTKGTVGRVAQIPVQFAEHVYSPQLCFLRSRDAGVIDPGWLYCWARSPQLSTQAGTHKDQTDMAPYISLRDLRRFRVTMPPVEDQRRIASVLGLLDDLIEANRRLSRGSSMLAVSLASVAPDSVPLRKFARLVDAQQFQPEGSIDHFSIPAFDERKLPERVDGAAIKSGKLRLMGPTVLVSRLNPQTPRVWMAYPGDTAAAASTEFVTLQSSPEASVEEVWAACASEMFAGQMRSRVTGTTGSHQRVDKSAIPSLMVADVRILDCATRTAISLLVRDAHESLIAASEAARIRDALLPLLLSGRVRVEDVAA